MRVFSAESPLSLPWTTLRLAGRYFLPLAACFAGGQALRWAVIWLGVTIGPGDKSSHQWHVAATLTLLVLLVMLTVTVPILMLHSVRRGILDGELEDRGIITSLSRSIFPFVIIYFAWNMIGTDAAEFARADIEQNASRYYTQPFQTDPSLNPGGLLLGIGFLLALIIAIASYYIRATFEYLANRKENRAYPIIAAFFEAAFNVFGLMSIVQALNAAANWWQERRVGAMAGDLWSSLLQAPVISSFLNMMGDVWPNLIGGVFLPLLWLTIAAAVYGRGLHEEGEAARGTRLQKLTDRVDAASNFRRWAVAHVGTSRREQWVPIGGAFRMALRAGAIAVGVFCLCFIGIDAVTQLAARGVVQLIGWQQDQAVWGPIMVPIEFVRDLLRTVLQMCLLAAMFDLAVRHERRREAEAAAPAPVSAGTPAPVPGPPASDRPSPQAAASAAPPAAPYPPRSSERGPEAPPW